MIHLFLERVEMASVLNAQNTKDMYHLEVGTKMSEFVRNVSVRKVCCDLSL